MNVHERTLGHYPLSIGTSLAIETIGRPESPDRDIPELPIPMKEYGVVAISVNTLIMNMVAALAFNHNGTADSVLLREMADTIAQEIMVIEEVIGEASPTTKVVPYVNTLGNISKLLLAKERLRLPKGLAGKKYQLYLALLGVLIARGYTHVYNSYTTVRLMKVGAKVLLLTSLPIDIVGNERAVHLLEPHTGVIRSNNTFYKKFYNVKSDDIKLVPFNRVTHLIFGDKHLIKPIVLKQRKQMLEVASSKSWMYNTSEKKVVSDVLASNFVELKDNINIYRRK